MKKDKRTIPRWVRQQVEAVAALPDDQIDTSDIPEITDWSNAQRGLFYKYRVIKKQVTLRLDAGIIAWFKAQSDDGRGYQTRINEALREHIHRQLEKQKEEQERGVPA
jgi:uncharacterized protein (DUF4415 family)